LTLRQKSLKIFKVGGVSKYHFLTYLIIFLIFTLATTKLLATSA
jgi:hypothetical protein